MAVLLAAGGATTGAASAPARLSVPHRGSRHLDSELGEVAHAAAVAGTPTALATAANHNIDVVGSRVDVIVQAKQGRTAAVAAAVARAGGGVSGRAGALVEALVPPAAITGLAADASVADVRPPAVTQEASVTDEGVAVSGAAAWHNAGYTGSGVTVAVIDLGFYNYASTLSGATVTTIDHCHGNLDAAPPTGTAHGAAVAEEVHAMAPGAQLLLICIDSEVGLAQAEADAISAGAKVVNHSVGWFDTSRGDGSGAAGTPDAIVADARAHGILWVNAAGNEATDHWSGTYTPSSGEPDLNTFSGANAPTNNVTIAAGENACVTLKWDDWPITTEDFDLGLFRASDGALVASSTDDQASSPGSPTEELCYTNPGPTQTFEIVIVRYSASGTPRLDLFYTGTSSLQYQTAQGSVVEPASSPDALAVGAVCWQSDALESYSSQGPTIDGRVKPDLSASDNVSSTVYGTGTSCGGGGFTGTSAAAPQVAGAAALLLQKTPSLTPAGLEAILTSRSLVHAGASAPANDQGSGPLWLDGVSTDTIGFSVVHGLYTIRSDGSGAAQPYTNSSLFFWAPSLSADGTKFAFSNGGGVIDVVGADGTGLTTVLNDASTSFQSPAWSPDGTKLAVEASGNIAVADADGSNLTYLTTGPFSTDPSWSPDGTQLAYIGFGGGGGLWTMNADGSNQRQIVRLLAYTGTSESHSCAWSPDGTKIAFSDGIRLYVVNSDGSGLITLTTASSTAPAPQYAVSPTWSPNGLQIAFEDPSYYGHGGRLFVIDADGSGLHQLTGTFGSPPDGPTWISVASAVVAPANAHAPVLAGTARVGQTLSVSAGGWSGTAPMTLTYAWSRCNSAGASCSTIAGATESSYSLVTSDAGSTFKATVTATNSASSASATTSLSGTAAGVVPYATAAPTVSGSTSLGSTLTVSSTGTWQGSPSSFTYQWRRCDSYGGTCADIGGATGSTHVVASADRGETLRVAVTGSSSGGSSVAASTALAIPGPPSNVTLPAVSGTAQQGSTLSASGGTWNGIPSPTLGYQWQRCDSGGGSCAAIGGATATTYVLAAADVGSTVRVLVTASNSSGSVSAASAVTAVVAGSSSGGGGGGSSGGGGGGSSGGGGGGSSGGGGGGSLYPDLHVTITAEQSVAPAVGGEVDFDLTVGSHPSTGLASDVFVDVTLPAGFAVTGTTTDRGKGCGSGGPGLVCDLDWIAPGIDGHVRIAGTVGQAGAQTISARTRHVIIDANPSDDSTTFTLEPAASSASTGAGQGSGQSPSGGGSSSGGSSSGAATAPTVVKAPKLKGTATVGTTLLATLPRWSAKPSRVVYRWQLCTVKRCKTIPGASARRLKLKPAYAGKRVRLVAIATIRGKTVRSITKKVKVKITKKAKVKR